MTNFELEYYQFSERSILVEWPQKIDESILDDVLMFKNHLLKSNTKVILDINNAYNSILIVYKLTIDNINDEISRLKTYYLDRISIKKSVTTLWKIPVCYDEKFGLDLEDISSKNKLSKSDIIRIHSEQIYTVFFIGFLPGFLYLGGLDNRLHFPRKKTPRSQVEKGAVAIGHHQTGIYPNQSPAGWNIIGNSPINFFDPALSEPCFAKPGDQMQFIPISLEEHTKIKTKVLNNAYQLESEVYDG